YAKLGLILLTAVILAGHRQGQAKAKPRPHPRGGAGAGPGAALPWAPAAAGLAVAVAAVNLHLLKASQLNRLTSFLNPSADPRGSGYSADQSKIAIGSGGLFGRGLFHGPPPPGNFV